MPEQGENINVWDALRRRKLVQWALVYAAAAWSLLQGLGLIADSYEWPHAVMRVAIGLMLIGLPVTLVLAWYHGERGEQRVRSPELVILALLLALGGGLLWWIERSSAQPPLAAGTASATPASTPATVPSAAPVPLSPPQKSIAVLPFVNMSADPDNEYFSDGVSEEILNALAKVDDLKVAGRTSSFLFKGKHESLTAIGAALGVAHVLEGSVRKQGGKVRITAQLIQVRDGFHLWSETYDGDLADVFALQERIARGIADELKVLLSPDQRQQLIDAGTANAEAYALFLEAAPFYHRRESDRYPEAIARLEQALALDPEFARAASRIAMLHATLASVELPGAAAAAARRYAARAMALDPKLAEPHLALGELARRERRYLEAREAMGRALALEPGDAAVGFHVGRDLLCTGYLRAGTERLDRTLLIDPMQPNALWRRGLQYSYSGDHDAAERVFERAAELGLSWAQEWPVVLAEGRGDMARARALQDQLPSKINVECLRDSKASVPVLRDALYGGDAAARTRARGVIEECFAASRGVMPSWVPIYLLRIDEPARALEVAQARLTDNENSLFNNLWSDYGKRARRLPAFSAFARDAGLAALWEQHGPPDLCQRRGPEDFVCN